MGRVCVQPCQAHARALLQECIQACLLLKLVNILYLSQYFPPEMGAPAGRVAEMSRLWVEDGHEVTVLTGFPNHPTGVVPREYRRQFRRLVTRDLYHGVNVVRTWLLPLPNRKAYERILNYGSFCISSAATGMLLRKPDVVIATSPQLLVGLSGWWLARLNGVPFVFEVRDLWPESLAAVGMGNEQSALHRGLTKVAEFLYRNCDRLVVVTPAFKDYLIEHSRVPEEKIVVVENGVDSNAFSRVAPNLALRRELDAEGRFVVSYIGTIGAAHGLETLLEAASWVRERMPEVLFLIVGEGADKARMKSLAGSRRLSNVRFVDQQPRETIPAYISASDACIVLLKKAELFKTVLPTKMLEFMSCARPIILGVDGHARKVMEQANAGIFITPQDPTALVEAVMRLASDPALRESMGRNGRQHILRYFSRRESARTYLDVLQDLLGTDPRRAAAAA
ncbi:MAG TPA: glycosyltransferase family 4 protein [Terriglobales bacterium]|nr:glycosyltransferase family 4 protein [Terriglobales bacterium]